MDHCHDPWLMHLMQTKVPPSHVNQAPAFDYKARFFLQFRLYHELPQSSVQPEVSSSKSRSPKSDAVKKWRQMLTMEMEFLLHMNTVPRARAPEEGMLTHYLRLLLELPLVPLQCYFP